MTGCLHRRPVPLGGKFQMPLFGVERHNRNLNHNTEKPSGSVHSVVSSQKIFYYYLIMFLVFVPMPFLWNPQHFLLANLLPFSVMRQCELKPMSCGWYGLLLSSPPPPPPPSNRPCKMNACPTNTADNHPQPTSTLTTAWQPRHAAALPPQ